MTLLWRLKPTNYCNLGARSHFHGTTSSHYGQRIMLLGRPLDPAQCWVVLNPYSRLTSIVICHYKVCDLRLFCIENVQRLYKKTNVGVYNGDSLPRLAIC